MMSKLNIIGAILSNCGVPISVMKFTESYTPILVPAPYVKNGEARKLSTIKQQDFIDNAFNILNDKPMQGLFYSSDNINCARAMALQIMVKFIGMTNPPAWHLPTEDFGIKSDTLLRSMAINENIPLIVLDGLNVFMNSSKSEKVTRIISLANCPVICIVSGKNPFNYCIERLGFTPQFIIRAEPEYKRAVTVSKSERI